MKKRQLELRPSLAALAAGLLVVFLTFGLVQAYHMEGIVTAPVPAPTPVSPTNGGTVTTLTPTFSWENTRPVDTFQLQVDDSSDFSSPAIDATVSQKQYTPSMALQNKLYYWRVKMTRTGVSSNWSDVWTVRVNAGPNLSIDPSSFVLESGGSRTLTATLTSSGSPLDGKTISWAATSGSVSPSTGTTDASGQASVTYTAPTVTASTTVTITASFAGDATYLSSEATSAGTALPQETAQVLENLKENLATQASQLEIQVENAQIQALENAFANGNLGACITVTAELGAPKIEFKNQSLDNVVVSVTSGERVEVTVSSAVAGGKTVLLSVDSQTIPTLWSGGISVLYDNVEIGPADGYTDVLDPTNDGDNAEYLVLFGGKGAQVLVSIPHFSTHTIVILSVPTSILLIYIAIVVVLIAAVLAVVVVRRSRGAKVQEAPAPPLLLPAPPPPPASPSQKFQG
jgi:hypothetical protein